MTRSAFNAGTSSIFIDDIGVTIGIGETFVIAHTSYNLWGASVDVDAFINSGDLEFILNGVTLVPVDALAVIHEVSPFNIFKEQGGTAVTVEVAKTIEVDGVGLKIVDLGNSTAQISTDPFGGDDQRLMFVECSPDYVDCIIAAYPIMNYEPSYLIAEEC